MSAEAGRNVLEGVVVRRAWRCLGVLAVGLGVIVAVACSGAEEAASPGEGGLLGGAFTDAPAQSETAALADTSTPELQSGQGPSATADPSPGMSEQATAARTPAPIANYDSTENMFRLFSGPMHDPEETRQAISLAVAHRDKSMVPVLIEMLRFVWGVDLPVATNAALSTITGREYGELSRAWHGWMEWLAKNADEYAPPDRYLDWKITLMNQIDPRFGEFLAPAEEGSRINLTELAWGGVKPDGIPDLQNAPVVYADEQDYLQPTDRVFGVSINGEHRAYPLRIVNAHEMANDVLGGEAIALAY